MLGLLILRIDSCLIIVLIFDSLEEKGVRVGVSSCSVNLQLDLYLTQTLNGRPPVWDFIYSSTSDFTR